MTFSLPFVAEIWAVKDLELRSLFLWVFGKETPNGENWYLGGHEISRPSKQKHTFYSKFNDISLPQILILKRRGLRKTFLDHDFNARLTEV